MLSNHKTKHIEMGLTPLCRVGSYLTTNIAPNLLQVNPKTTRYTLITNGQCPYMMH